MYVWVCVCVCVRTHSCAHGRGGGLYSLLCQFIVSVCVRKMLLQIAFNNRFFQYIHTFGGRRFWSFKTLLKSFNALFKERVLPCFSSMSPKNNNSPCHNCPTHKCPIHISHECPISIFHYVLTSHLMHVQKIFR